jgi:type VI secretion system secreted protein VgrG
MTFTQENRRLKIETPLGPNALLLTQLHGVEGVSTLFHFDMELISESAALSFESLVGKAVTASIETTVGHRYINGIVSRFKQSAPGSEFTVYTARIVPWPWFLTRMAGCRIFQKLSIPDIIKKVFTDNGFSEFSLRLKNSYEPRDYCVQYRETAYNFVARLLEEVGIYYFFEHAKDKHTLVLADDPLQHKPCPDISKVQFNSSEDFSSEDNIVSHFDKEQEIRSGRYVLSDYNFEKPSLDLTATAEGSDASKYEVYDYPGEYEGRNEGDRLARIRQEEEDFPRVLFRGSGICPTFTSGYRFDLSRHPVARFDGTYVLTSVTHDAREPAGYAGDVGGGTSSYSNSFECIRSSVPYRPPRLTPQPRVLVSRRQ